MHHGADGERRRGVEIDRCGARDRLRGCSGTGDLLAWSGAAEVPVEDGKGRVVVSPAGSALRDEMAVNGQRLLAVSGQIPKAASKRPRRPRRKAPRNSDNLALSDTADNDVRVP